MYKLLLVSDRDDVLAAFDQISNWERQGFKPPHIRHDFEGTVDSLSKHHADGICISVVPAEEEKILSYLQANYPNIPLFEAGTTPDEILRYLNELPDASNVGGVCETMPANESKKAQAIAIACSHTLGVGNSMFRTAKVHEPVKADTVPFGFWRKSLFDQMGMFDEEMTRNQDDEFNARTIQNGGHIYLVPGICIRYFARDTLAKTWGMFYQYGLFKPLVNKKIKHPATVRQFVPLLFVISLLIGLPLACLFPMVRIIYLTIIALYIVLLGFEGLKYKNAYLPPVFATIHIGYGLGYMHGIVKVLCKRPFYVETNR